MEKNAKIYIAGHRGLVGSAIWKNLQDKGYTNLIGRTHKELDLQDGMAVRKFFPLPLWVVSWRTVSTVPTLYTRICRFNRTLSERVSVTM